MEGINNNGDQIPMNNPASTQISAKTIAAKFQSKHEIYYFLRAECNVYLPH